MKKIFVLLLMLLPCMAFGADNEKTVSFQLYGTDVTVHFDASKRVKLKKNDSKQMAKCMQWIDQATEQTVKDCQQVKTALNLSDWAYVKLADKLSTTCLGNTNEATLMAATLLKKSGYAVKVAWEKDKTLRLLYNADASVCDANCMDIDGKHYFLYDTAAPANISDMKVVDNGWKGRPVSMRINGEQKFAMKLTEPRTVTSFNNKDFTFTFQVNKNLIDFYGDMPAVVFDNDFMTKWTSMANIPLEKRLQDTLVKDMKKKLKGLSQREAVQKLLTWTQGKIDLDGKEQNPETFLFRYDDDVWGKDRAFYAEETLFYPWCDTEDRSILLSRLVRDVLGLRVVFIFYTTHTAVGVCFTDEDIKGAYVVKDGMHFVICDPTYIGSNIGEEMPSVENQEKTVRLLEP